MQPLVYNIRYYQGDSFTISVFPKDSTGAAIDLSGGDVNPYFRLAQYRDNITGWNANGNAEITNLSYGAPLCIKCDMTSTMGQNIKNGYVYDIGYVAGGKRVTVLTGSFQLMSEVKTSGNTS